MQIDMFMSEDIQSLNGRVEKVEISTKKVQRGLFARNTALEKRMVELEDQNRELQSQVYKLMKRVYEDSEKIIPMQREG